MGVKKKFHAFASRTRTEIRQRPALAVVYIILRLLVISIMVAQILNKDYNNVLLCVLTLILFMIPSFVEHKIKVDVPDTLEIIILFFIFAAEILGEIREYFVNVPGWDTMLHTITGFLAAAIGLALIDILNRSDRFSIKLSPFFVALVAFCFSMTIGVIWEFFEFTMDIFFNKDMQKDTIIGAFNSVTIHPDGRNIPVIVTDITKTVINGSVDGVPAQIEINGYLDIGIIDTMRDLFVNFIGAVVFSIIGYFYVRSDGRGRFVRRFILTRMPEPSKTDTEDISEPSAADCPVSTLSSKK
jgi:hypothetical protein